MALKGLAVKSVPWTARELSRRIPFFYGWLILAAVCCAGFARQGPAVATLSIFIDPMTNEFGWSRTAISGAVSLGGVLAAVAAPFLGPLLDRHGARVILTAAVLVTGLCTFALSLSHSLIWFFVAFCLARMCFAGPFDLGIYGAINNWFVRRRALATSTANLAMMAGLVAMPLIAHTFIASDGWRVGWIAVAVTVVGVGLLPVWLLIARQPEDIGLRPDGTGEQTSQTAKPVVEEPYFTRAQALRTRAFWTLSAFTALTFPVQAGFSLHQAPHLIEIGLTAATATLIVSTFSFASGLSGIIFGLFAATANIRVLLSLVATLLAASMLLMAFAQTAMTAWGAAVVFGLGIGGLLTVLPIAWADYFGRRSFGAIRGVALSVQVIAQALGPLLSGLMRDLTGNYALSLYIFAGFSACALVAALGTARPPRPVHG